MSFKIIPLDMISAPNTYAPLADGLWVLNSSNAQTLWFRIDVVDSLGQRPYVTASGSTLKLTFQRADLLSLSNQGNLINTPQNVEKIGAANSLNRSIYSVSMTSQDVQKAVSGTVKFELTEGSTVNTWVQNWMVKKTSTSPGF